LGLDDNFLRSDEGFSAYFTNLCNVNSERISETVFKPVQLSEAPEKLLKTMKFLAAHDIGDAVVGTLLLAAMKDINFQFCDTTVILLQY
jgi:hypothetical protein